MYFYTMSFDGHCTPLYWSLFAHFIIIDGVSGK